MNRHFGLVNEFMNVEFALRAVRQILNIFDLDL